MIFCIEAPISTTTVLPLMINGRIDKDPCAVLISTGVFAFQNDDIAYYVVLMGFILITLRATLASQYY